MEMRSTPTSKPHAAAVAAPKIRPRRVISFIAVIREKNLFCRAHRWRRQEREPLGFSARPAHFQFLEQQRRSHHRSREAALCRAKRPQGCAGKSVDLALHVVVSETVVADTGEVSQRARGQSNDARAAD